MAKEINTTISLRGIEHSVTLTASDETWDGHTKWLVTDATGRELGTVHKGEEGWERSAAGSRIASASGTRTAWFTNGSDYAESTRKNAIRSLLERRKDAVLARAAKT
jgi:hypothetical protein